MDILPLYPLQNVKSSGHPGAEDLYQRRMPPSTVVDFNTFFSSFYESYWRAYTRVRTLFFSFTIQGAGTLKLYRQVEAMAAVSIFEARYAGEKERVQVRVPDPQEADGGRVFAIFEPEESSYSITEAAWETDQPPALEVGLAAVVCTFNREDDVCNLVEKFAQASGVVEVIIVNHGEKGLSNRLAPRLSAYARSLPTTFCDQDNLGGSGGFSRGMYAAQQHGKASHILLCDDDIAIDPDIITRIAAVLRYSDGRLALGGMMLDRFKPTWLHNNVTTFRDDLFKVVTPLPNVDLAESMALAPLSVADTADMNGWWCYAFPCSYLQKTGFALPFFLHYDDGEFGLRLGELGCRTVSWPGIAVWHEPFYAKQQSVRRYYDFRNVLFLFRGHKRLHRLACLRQFTWRFAINLVQYQYDSAWSILQAMADYLAGPSLLAAWSAEDHRSLLTRAQAWGEEPLPCASCPEKSPVSPFVPQKESGALARRILSDLVRPVTELTPPCVEPTAWHIWGATGYDAYAFYFDKEKILQIYRRSPVRALRLGCRFVGLFVAFACGWDYRWRVSDLTKLSSLDFWRQKWLL